MHLIRNFDIDTVEYDFTADDYVQQTDSSQKNYFKIDIQHVDKPRPSTRTKSNTNNNAKNNSNNKWSV